ncbi:MAG: hypothetical protein J1F22_07295 [Lachnospiraceae bacterium]|nr:hypothetical protein [Lachnospiraceae bacterium]
MSNVIAGKYETVTVPRFRDVLVRYQVKDITLAILGLENQERIHYAMPLRSYLYDGLSYQKQCDAIMRKHRKKRDLFELFRILHEQSCTIKERQEKAIQYGNQQQIDSEVAEAVVAASSNLRELKALNKEKGGNDMCEVFESIFNEGKEEGIQQGKLEGKQEGLLGTRPTSLM